MHRSHVSPTSPVFAIAIVALALVTTFALAQRFGAPSEQGRFVSIDGLRGYLALAVFLHHSCIWYFYLRGGEWTFPPSNLYTHFGPSAVAMFFMITGFLFFTKLLNARVDGINPFDWDRLYVGRLLRLAPLYGVVMLLMFAIVAVATGAVLREPFADLAGELSSWLLFSIPGRPDLNGLAHTRVIVAGVTWSLAYEWFFYLSLPILALVAGLVPPRRYLALGVAALIVFVLWQPEARHLLAFGVGIAASIAARSRRVRMLATHKASSIIAVVAAALAVARYPTAYGTVPVLLMGATFAIIACGNSLCGVLGASVSRLLGEMAYSLYLLHGLLLYLSFGILGALMPIDRWSPLQHWLCISMLTPLLVGLSFLSFRYIEKPALQKVPGALAWLRGMRSAARYRKAA